MLEKLKKEVCFANRELETQQLALFSTGSVSALDKVTGYIVTRPSGVPFSELTPNDMVVVSPTGDVVEGDCDPTVELSAHMELYRSFHNIGAVIHFRSHYATCFAQACRPIPVYGTVHADHFCGEIPCTREMSRHELSVHYEKHVGQIVTSAFRYLDERKVPGVLVARHGAYVWGKSVSRALQNAVSLEKAAHMAFVSEQLNPRITPLTEDLVERRFYRFHSRNAEE